MHAEASGRDGIADQKENTVIQIGKHKSYQETTQHKLCNRIHLLSCFRIAV